MLGGGEKKRKERDGGKEFLCGAPTSRVLKWRRLVFFFFFFLELERANEQSFAIGLGLQVNNNLIIAGPAIGSAALSKDFMNRVYEALLPYHLGK